MGGWAVLLSLLLSFVGHAQQEYVFKVGAVIGEIGTCSGKSSSSPCGERLLRLCRRRTCGSGHASMGMPVIPRECLEQLQLDALSHTGIILQATASTSTEYVCLTHRSFQVLWSIQVQNCALRGGQLRVSGCNGRSACPAALIQLTCLPDLQGLFYAWASPSTSLLCWQSPCLQAHAWQPYKPSHRLTAWLT